nr:1847_t:CDS:10 [Entrophospora candida]
MRKEQIDGIKETMERKKRQGWGKRKNVGNDNYGYLWYDFNSNYDYDDKNASSLSINTDNNHVHHIHHDEDLQLLPPLQNFIQRLVTRSSVSTATFLTTIIYLDRLKKKLPKLARGMHCTRHRVFLAILIVASKYLNDSSPRNKYWARFSSVYSVNKVNLMERQLLTLLDYDLRVTEAELLLHLSPFLKSPSLSTSYNNNSSDQFGRRLSSTSTCSSSSTSSITTPTSVPTAFQNNKDASRDIHIHTPNILKKPKIVSKDPVKWYKNTREILLAVKSNFLLIFLPPAIILKRFDVNDFIVLIFNFLAIIPLSKIMTTGIDDLSARFHPSYGAILHAFAGNFVELVISCYALLDRQYSIVRSSLLGAILCNILLVLGVVFLAGSWPRKKSKRESMNAHLSTQLFVSTSASTLALAVLALVTPAAFKIAAPVGTGIECDLQNISHAIAIILLFVYAALLIFQLKTHVTSTISMDEVHYREPKYFLLFDIFLIVASITGIVVCARYLVTSIEHTAHSFRLGNGFIGMVLLPLCVVSNFMEHYDAIKEASEDKIDTAVGLILNTSQIALLVTPVLVLFGWITSRPLTLDFNTLEICVLACAVLIVNYLVADGKANWLEGYMLIVSYVIIAVAFFYFPNVPELKEAVILKCNPFSRNLPPDDFGLRSKTQQSQKADCKNNRKKVLNNEKIPKRPLNAFFIFVNEKRPEYVEKYPNYTAIKRASIIRKLWSSMSKKEKEIRYNN